MSVYELKKTFQNVEVEVMEDEAIHEKSAPLNCFSFYEAQKLFNSGEEIGYVIENRSDHSYKTSNKESRGLFLSGERFSKEKKRHHSILKVEIQSPEVRFLYKNYFPSKYFRNFEGEKEKLLRLLSNPSLNRVKLRLTRNRLSLSMEFSKNTELENIFIIKPASVYTQLSRSQIGLSVVFFSPQKISFSSKELISLIREAIPICRSLSLNFAIKSQRIFLYTDYGSSNVLVFTLPASPASRYLIHRAVLGYLLEKSFTFPISSMKEVMDFLATEMKEKL